MLNNKKWFFLGLIFISQFSLAAGEYTIEVYKSDRLLLVKKDHILQQTFRISSGSGGLGDKTRRGDNTTPTGVYTIQYLKESSRFHLFMQINYPNTKDALDGLKNNTINQYEFGKIINALKRKTLPDQNTDLGGAIGFHGIGNQTEDRLILHEDENWTQGCIAMKNEEIEALRNFVHIGTSVVIFD